LGGRKSALQRTVISVAGLPLELRTCQTGALAAAPLCLRMRISPYTLVVESVLSTSKEFAR
jgi:hypothetical protein